MSIKNLIRMVSILAVTVSISCASASVQNNNDQREKTDPIDSILEKLNKRTQELDSYQCQVEYRYVQPSVFETQTLRKGTLYYSRLDGKSKMRVNFQTLKQDEDEEQKYNEQYIVVDGSALPKSNTNFEGIWLVDIDYENKSVKFIQIAQTDDPNKSVNVFDLVSKKFPMVGFTKSNQLKEQFDISLVEQKNSESGDIIQVHLKVKPNSVYKDDYVQIDFWIDEKLNLPVKIKAISTEPAGEPLDQKDFCEIKCINAKTNEKIDKNIFDFQIPKGFDEPEIYPLNKDDN
jgi:outer membrane lipoprotein-sorting protein